MRSTSAAALAPADAADVAGEAGLRYVSDAAPGIRRLRRGKRFQYRGPDGKPVRDAATLARIRALAIPPAYEDVWVCPDPRGHIQATGRDARGRKQYRYHPRWHAARTETKFDRMLAFSEALPRIRRTVARDLARDGLPREKVLAAVVHLLENTCIRVGNEEYARANDSFGLTTLRDGHARVRGSRVVLEFRGKRGKHHRCEITDRRLARVIARCQAIPGEELFQYVDADGTRQSIDSGDVNEYLRAICGDGFSAKDFRTWSATLLAGSALLALGAVEPLTERRRRMLATVDEVAHKLNNTRAVCRKYYVHPGVLEAFEAGTLAASLRSAPASASARSRHGLSAEERALVGFLRRAKRAARAARTRRKPGVRAGSARTAA
jgi:DNA topoisomerase-1